jgi:hypothetical protein
VVALDQIHWIGVLKKLSFRTERENLPMPQEQVGLEVAFAKSPVLPTRTDDMGDELIVA